MARTVQDSPSTVASPRALGQPPNPLQAGLRYRVGIMGCPQSPDVAWTRENLERVKELGFNALQLNIAWGWRPADEPLNLEDLVDVPEAVRAELSQPMPLQCDPSPERRKARREDLKRRVALCHEAGIHTIFHFGAPYIGDRNYNDASPNCLLDGKTPERCEALLDVFASEFPGIDDIHLYTYDQHSWLCSEFGPCPRCTGIPLDKRVVPFIERLAAAWRRHNPRRKTLVGTVGTLGGPGAQGGRGAQSRRHRPRPTLEYRRGHGHPARGPLA